jgi:esterase/lipase
MMQFKVKGNYNHPKILLVHAMYTDWRCFQTLVGYLENEYCIIIPTLDGHGTDDTVFHSVQEEADNIIKYLYENNISKLELIDGISLGGIIAFEVFRRRQIEIKHMFLDGAPFVLLPAYKRKFMGFLFKRVAHSVKKHPDKIGILDKKFPKFAREMKEICFRMTDESIKNLSEACYTYQLPETIELGNETITFMYGTAEKASMCIPTVRKYTNTKLIIKEGYKHCQFISDFPKEYFEQLKRIMNGSKQTS